jgi:hypothetical protein
MNVYEIEFENLYTGERFKNILAENIEEATKTATEILKAAKENFGEDSDIVGIKLSAKITGTKDAIAEMVAWNKEAQEQFKKEEEAKK